MCVELQQILRYVSENTLKDRDETPPLGTSLPSKALKKKLPAPEPEGSSSDGGGVQNWSPKGYEHRRGKQAEYRYIKGPGNDSHFASSCWGKG